MKKFSIILLTILSVNTALANNWMTSFEEAKKLALASDKLVLVDFWAIWCGPCKKMDTESWSKDEVKMLMDNYVPVQVDIDKNKDLASQYGVKGIPYIFIMDGNGKVLYNSMSYKRKDEVINLLNKYAIKMSFLKRDLLNYYQNSSFITSLRLASKYQDFCLYLNEELKPDFLGLSHDYIKESKKFLKSSDIENKNTFEQKIELFEIQEKLILNKPEKALKMLSKLKKEDIDKNNESFYTFLNYTALKQMNDDKNAAKWEDGLMENYLKKANQILNNS